MTAIQILITLLLTPLVTATLIALFMRRLGAVASYFSVTAAGLICILCVLAIDNFDGTAIAVSWDWLRFGAFEVQMGFLFDGIAATMLTMVAFVGFLIHIFSLGYMQSDTAKARFFGGLSIFMFSMLGIILADNLIMVFVFWELVGFSSYMLIGHYLETQEAKEASKKAFIVNRIGDLGFLVGIVYAYWHFGTVNIAQLEALVAAKPDLINATIAALLMCGFIGKSAQFPLHVWLPDAMAGPTPVSALIHAATMVAAGVYFLIRIVFLFPIEVLDFISYLGAAVAVYAGFCAYAQHDIKKILAYSTLSQLGYMAAAFGLGYPGVAFFHLITHAFFKALLFLGAGSVIHGCHHEQNIFKMGGLLKRMPVTSITFAIGLMALCGVYGMSGFYSKDAILIASGLTSTPIFVLLVISAFLTAGYMGRLFWVAFLGTPNSEVASHAKESPMTLLLPLVILALLSIVGGLLQLWPDSLGGLIRYDVDRLHYAEQYDSMHYFVLKLGTAAWIIGLFGALFFYRVGASEDRLKRNFLPIFQFLHAKLWFDEIYNFYIANVQQRFAHFLNLLDLLLIEGLLVRGSAGAISLLGTFARSLHVGNLHSYVYWFLAGMLLLWLACFGLF